MRILSCLGAAILCLVAATANAQPVGPFKIQPNGCVKAGQILTISGRGFGRVQTGDIVAQRGAKSVKLAVRNWSDRRVKAGLPRGARFQADGFYSLMWTTTGAGNATLGRIKFCEPEKVVRPGKPTRPAKRDEVPAPSGAPEYVVASPTGQAGAIATALQGQGATLLRNRALNALGLRMMFFDFPPALALPVARQIVSGISNAATVDPHHIYGFAAEPRLYAASVLGDPQGQQCSLRRAVRVGVIDGPVNGSAAAMSGVKLVQVNVFKNGEKPVPADHGTAVAGLIAGPANAGALQGVAAGAQIYSAPAFSRGKSGAGAMLENVAAALNWMAAQNVRLVNMSFAGNPNRALGTVLSAAAGKGLVLVAAAGNNGKKINAYPAGAPEVIAVTAVDIRGKLYQKANTGAHIEFAAPGVDVWSAKGNGGTYRSGTSFAAPMVTGLIARSAAKGSVSLSKARAEMKRSVLDLGSAGRDEKFGWGLVQASGC